MCVCVFASSLVYHYHQKAIIIITKPKQQTARVSHFARDRVVASLQIVVVAAAAAAVLLDTHAHTLIREGDGEGRY